MSGANYTVLPNATTYFNVGVSANRAAEFRACCAAGTGVDWPIRQFTDKNCCYRFECRQGDHWPGWTATPLASELTVNRTEMEGKGPPLNPFKFGVDIWWSYSFFIEDGPVSTAQWCVLGQWHNSGDSGDGVQSPPFAFILMPGDYLAVVIRRDANAITASNPPEQVLWKSAAPIKRGIWHNQVHRVNFDWVTGGTGKVDVWLDGVHIVDYAGPIGYNDAKWHYPKFGIYRSIAPETLAVQYANHEFYVDERTSVLYRAMNPLPIA